MAEIRQQLADAIKSGLTNARRFRIVSDEKAVARIERPLIRVSQKGFARTPEAPLRNLTVRFNVRVTSPLADLDAAESQLNELVPEVLAVIETIPRVKWTDAEKVLDPDVDRLAYDIPLTIIARKE
jgi:hypothetical protein